MIHTNGKIIKVLEVCMNKHLIKSDMRSQSKLRVSSSFGLLALFMTFLIWKVLYKKKNLCVPCTKFQLPLGKQSYHLKVSSKQNILCPQTTFMNFFHRNISSRLDPQSLNLEFAFSDDFIRFRLAISIYLDLVTFRLAKRPWDIIICQLAQSQLSQGTAQ